MTPSDVKRRMAVAYAALPVVQAGRWVQLARLPAVARIAVLAEAAGSLAAIARWQARVSHVDAWQVACLVTDPADAMAVLGLGRWLPTMQRRVLAYPVSRSSRPTLPLRVRGPRHFAGQLSLFATNDFQMSSGSR